MHKLCSMFHFTCQPDVGMMLEFAHPFSLYKDAFVHSSIYNFVDEEQDHVQPHVGESTRERDDLGEKTESDATVRPSRS